MYFEWLWGKKSSVHGIVCAGNGSMQRVNELIELISAEGQIPVRVTANDIFLGGTIRHCKCKLLSEKPRCSVCQIHRSEIIQILSRQKLKRSRTLSLASSIPNKALTTSQLQQKVSRLQTERWSLKRRVNALQHKVVELFKQEYFPR